MEQGTNGNVKWRDLEERDTRLQEKLDKRLERAHKYANDRLNTLEDAIAQIVAKSEAITERELSKSGGIHDSIHDDIVELSSKIDATAEREVLKFHKHLEKLDVRVKHMESTLDQQRGARNLVYFLIGSNLMVVAGLIIAVVIAVTG